MTTRVAARPTVATERDTSPLVSLSIGSPLGPLLLVAAPRGLRAVHWQAKLPDRGDDPPPRGPRSGTSAAHDALRAAAAQLAAYFAGTRTTFDLPLDPLGTPFQSAAWAILRGIPFGTTISYADQARRLGDARKARAVGASHGRNPLPIIVPCHRVIGSGGALVGFAAGMEAKAWLLRHEQAVAGAACAGPSNQPKRSWNQRPLSVS